MKELSSDFEVSTQTRSTVDLVCLKTSRSLLNPFIYCGAKIASNQAPCWPGWIFRAGGVGQTREERTKRDNERRLAGAVAVSAVRYRASACTARGYVSLRFALPRCCLTA